MLLAGPEHSHLSTPPFLITVSSGEVSPQELKVAASTARSTTSNPEGHGVSQCLLRLGSLDDSPILLHGRLNCLARPHAKLVRGQMSKGEPSVTWEGGLLKKSGGSIRKQRGTCEHLLEDSSASP